MELIHLGTIKRHAHLT